MKTIVIITIILITVIIYFITIFYNKTHNIYDMTIKTQRKIVISHVEDVIHIKDSNNITECPKTRLYFNSDGNMMIGTEKNVTVQISYINELLHCEWILIDAYYKHDMQIFKWKHKETGEIKEGGIHPPSHTININELK